MDELRLRFLSLNCVPRQNGPTPVSLRDVGPSTATSIFRGQGPLKAAASARGCGACRIFHTPPKRVDAIHCFHFNLYPNSIIATLGDFRLPLATASLTSTAIRLALLGTSLNSHQQIFSPNTLLVLGFLHRTLIQTPLESPTSRPRTCLHLLANPFGSIYSTKGNRQLQNSQYSHIAEKIVTMAFDPAANAGPPLDEIQWHTPPQFEGGLHSNSILYYFAQSPFYDKTSNNEVVFQQGLNNQAMSQYLATRELFESRLREMSGLEFIVAQEPAETGPGMGTGVWVINKQTRRKRPPTNPVRPEDGPPDEIIVHSTYFVVGENIYMAPTLADVISSRIVRLPRNKKSSLPVHNTNTSATGRNRLRRHQDPPLSRRSIRLGSRRRPPLHHSRPTIHRCRQHNQLRRLTNRHSSPRGPSQHDHDQQTRRHQDRRNNQRPPPRLPPHGRSPPHARTLRHRIHGREPHHR